MTDENFDFNINPTPADEPDGVDKAFDKLELAANVGVEVLIRSLRFTKRLMRKSTELYVNSSSRLEARLKEEDTPS